MNYFAYGSNMDEAQMRSRVPGSRKIGTGYLSGHEFCFSGFSQRWQGSVANVRPKTGKRVFGVVYSLPVGGLDRLDRFEGYPTAYQRKSRKIRLVDGGELPCVLYFKRRHVADAPPNPAYVGLILRALKKHGA